MSIGNAIKFIKKVQEDADFRKSMYMVNDYHEFEALMEAKGMGFSQGEYEEAFNHLHVQCQFSEEADQLYTVNHFIRLLY